MVEQQKNVKEIAEQHIITVKALLLQHFPFYGGLLSTMKMEAKKLPENAYAATDGHSTIFYDPEKIAGLTKNELIFTLAHEVTHVSLKHIIRLGNRNPRIFNIAADYAVNSILEQDNVGSTSMYRKMGVLYDSRFENMPVEQIYDIINKNPDQYSMINPINNHEFWDFNDNLRYDEDTEGSNKKMANIPRPTGSQIQKIDSEINNKIAQAISIEKQLRGNISSRIARDFMKKLEEPRVDWRQLLAQYLEETSTNNTYRRFNKKYLPMGVLLPTPNVERTRINIMLDVSGSISDKLLKQFVSDVWYLISSQDAYEEVGIYQVDTDIVSHIKVAVGDDLGEVSSKIFTRNGSGGTDFISFFKHLESNNNQSITIVFTDGDATIPDKEPNFPVIFIYTRRKLEWGINILYNEEK